MELAGKSAVRVVRKSSQKERRKLPVRVIRFDAKWSAWGADAAMANGQKVW
jgi:hypothetical protein